MTRRIRIVVGIGDVLQLVGAGAAGVAIWHLAGLWWGVLFGAVFVFIEANLTYGNKGFAIPLPNRQDRLTVGRRMFAPARAARRLARRLASKARSS